MIRPGTCTPPRLPGMSTPTLLHRNGNGDDALADSWVDVGNVLSSYASGFSSSNQSMHTSGLATPPMNFVSEEYLKLLREAQRESNQSSAIMSLASSRRDSLHGSPGCKSPPNSPNTELSLSCEDLRGVFINGREEVPKDWIWDWSSRPDMVPPKEWKFNHPKKHGMSMRNAKVGNQSLFSKEVLYTLLLTNMLSICLGATIGLWLSFRRSRWLTTAGSM